MVGGMSVGMSYGNVEEILYKYSNGKNTIIIYCEIDRLLDPVRTMILIDEEN